MFERIRKEFLDNFDEELEMELEDYSEDKRSDEAQEGSTSDFRRSYFRELHRLQVELVKLQDWVVAT